MPREPHIQRTEVSLDGETYPLTIHRELRRNLRASLGREGFVLRLPAWLNRAEEEESLRWFKRWASRKVAEKEGFARQFRRRAFRDGEEIQVGRRRYRLAIVREDRRTHSARLREGVITLRLNREESGPTLNKTIRHLLSRTVAADFLPEIRARINHFNATYFGKTIKQVRLKW